MHMFFGKVLYWRLIVLTVFAYSCFLTFTPSALANEALPVICRIGIFITSLHDFQPADNSFSADFWLWSICPTDSIKPLDTIQISRSKKLDAKLGTTEKKGSMYWSQRQFSGVFHHKWNIINFPFDHQTLEFELEDGVNDASKLVYFPDAENSGYSEELKLQGFKFAHLDKFDNLKLSERKSRYSTTFGNPNRTKRSDFSHILVRIEIKRNERIGFFKLNTPTYVAFALSILSFFMLPKLPPVFAARMGLLVGCLFAVVVNMRSSESILGRTSSLTLVDQIHISTMIYLFISATIAVISLLNCEAGKDKLAKFYDRRLVFLYTISFIMVNLILILNAYFNG